MGSGQEVVIVEYDVSSCYFFVEFSYFFVYVGRCVLGRFFGVWVGFDEEDVVWYGVWLLVNWVVLFYCLGVCLFEFVWLDLIYRW